MNKFIVFTGLFYWNMAQIYHKRTYGNFCKQFGGISEISWSYDNSSDLKDILDAGFGKLNDH